MSSQKAQPTQLYGTNSSREHLRDSFTSGQVPVAVYGLGKMGLPLAAAVAETTGNVTGVDIDESVVDRISAGRCPVDHEPGLDALTERLVEDDALAATTDGVGAASGASVHILIVPTEVREDGTVDLSTLEGAVETVAAGLEPGDLVLVESTVPPRTTAEVIEPTLATKSGLDPDEFGLAFCPERTSSGRALRDIRGAYPKVVGGRDEESRAAATLVYETLTSNDVVPVSDATTAECVKVFEGVYRDVNIALANELATLTDELSVDVREAIDVANGQPYCDIHTPGPGVGGHCIPYYPYFLITECSTTTPMLQTARTVNDEMAAYTVEKLEAELDALGIDLDNARVALLGVTYRPGIDETRASPARRIDSALAERGTTTFAVDPVCSDMSPFAAITVNLEELPERDIDAVVLVTAHDEFAAFDWRTVPELLVVDTQNALDLEDTDHHVYTLGRGRK
ncbi:MAG: nucleotide sugar dehydrogenase [Haloarculaceae archaeon]